MPLFQKIEASLEEISKVSMEDKEEIEKMIMYCKSTFSCDYVKNHHIDSDLHYNKLIGDVCYRYKK